MSGRLALLGVAFLWCVPLQSADKPDFTGTWRLEGAGNEAALKIQQSESGIRLSGASASGTETRVDCNTRGKECDAQLAGEAVKVTYYYNGPMLVETVYAGKDGTHVTKTRRTLSADGARMTVEVIPMAPAGKPSKFVYVRQAPVTSLQPAAEPQP